MLQWRPPAVIVGLEFSEASGTVAADQPCSLPLGPVAEERQGTSGLGPWFWGGGQEGWHWEVFLYVLHYPN